MNTHGKEEGSIPFCLTYTVYVPGVFMANVLPSWKGPDGFKLNSYPSGTFPTVISPGTEQIISFLVAVGFNKFW